MRTNDGTPAEVDLQRAILITAALAALGFDEDKDADAYWRASDVLNALLDEYQPETKTP
jgi:hypothetical protein